VAARSVSGRTSREFGRPGRHLLEVVNDLLDVSRLEAGRFPVTLALARIGHAIDVGWVTAVPGRAADVRYWGDESRVRQRRRRRALLASDLRLSFGCRSRRCSIRHKTPHGARFDRKESGPNDGGSLFFVTCVEASRHRMQLDTQSREHPSVDLHGKLRRF
jgi:hypothetical protein